MTSILFSYGHHVYSEFHETCKEQLINFMFENRSFRSYSWADAVKDVSTSMAGRFVSCPYKSSRHYDLDDYDWDDDPCSYKYKFGMYGDHEGSSDYEDDDYC